jgi:hypothetical protein
VVIVAALPVALLVTFAIVVLARDVSGPARVAAWCALVLAAAIVTLVAWVAVEFARDYHF